MRALQYLIFNLGGDRYAVDVENVNSVLEVPHITRLPKTPQFIRGLINLRGSVIPVVDLKSKFEMGRVGTSDSARIVVLDVPGIKDRAIIGALADSVYKVVDLERVEDIPRLGTMIDNAYIKGVGRFGGRFVVILDIEKVLAPQELLCAKKGKT